VTAFLDPVKVMSGQLAPFSSMALLEWYVASWDFTESLPVSISNNRLPVCQTV